MDQDGKDAVFYQLALRYNWLETKKEKMDLLIEIEFMNHLPVEEFKIKYGLDVARGRSGKRNDQCHVEQKNHTFARELFGHARIEFPGCIDLMNEIYEV